jgi:hypothetical protein
LDGYRVDVDQELRRGPRSGKRLVFVRRPLLEKLVYDVEIRIGDLLEDDHVRRGHRALETPIPRRRTITHRHRQTEHPPEVPDVNYRQLTGVRGYDHDLADGRQHLRLRLGNPRRHGDGRRLRQYNSYERGY